MNCYPDDELWDNNYQGYILTIVGFLWKAIFEQLWTFSTNDDVAVNSLEKETFLGKEECSFNKSESVKFR